MIDQTPKDELDYYDIKKIEHKNLKEKWNTAVTEEDIRKYCAEFIDTFQSFVKEGYVLNSEWATSENGVVVRFSTSKEVKPLRYNKDLETINELMKELGREHKIEDILKGRKVKFYDKSGSLYFCKPNKLKNWTEFMGIRDSNKCLWKLIGKLK